MNLKSYWGKPAEKQGLVASDMVGIEAKPVSDLFFNLIWFEGLTVSSNTFFSQPILFMSTLVPNSL